VRAWRAQTPADFLFAWKASKFITHWKRLSAKSANSIELMETRLRALSPKVGAVLFQLPPQFAKNRERLASFLEMLPPRHLYAFEFRHRSWLRAWARDIAKWRRQRRTVFVYFDNDQKSAAPADARRLMEALRAAPLNA